MVELPIYLDDLGYPIDLLRIRGNAKFNDEALGQDRSDRYPPSLGISHARIKKNTAKNTSNLIGRQTSAFACKSIYQNSEASAGFVFFDGNTIRLGLVSF